MELIPVRHGRSMAATAFVGMVLLGLIGAAAVEDRGDAPWGTYMIFGTAFLLVSELFLAFTLRFFLAGRGGLHLDPARGELRVGTMGGERHDLVVPVGELTGLRMSPRWEEAKRGERVLATLELERGERATVLIGEHDNPETVRRVAGRVGEATGLRLQEDEVFNGEPSRPRAGFRSEEISLGRGWHMFWPITSLGLLAAVTGSILLTLAGRSFFFGIIVSPFLLVAAMVLLGLSWSLSRGREDVSADTETIQHRILLGKREVFASSLDAGQRTRVRVRPNGARGTSIECVTPSKMLVFGNGLTGDTTVGVGEALARADALKAALFEGVAGPNEASDGSEPDDEASLDQRSDGEGDA